MKTAFLLASFGAGLAAIGAPPANAFPHLSVSAAIGCSGALVRAPHAALSARALVLTNGHCLDFRPLHGGTDPLPPPGVRYLDVHREDFLSRIRLIVQTEKGPRDLSPGRLVFAAMDETDLSLLELEETYAGLEEKYSLRAAPLSFTLPKPGTPVTVQAGYFSREIRCPLGAAVATREGPYRWPHSVRLGTECEIYPGVSGSPVIDDRTGLVVAVANTHFSAAGALCSIHNPCEIGASGEPRRPAPEQAYGISLAPLAGCFDAGGNPAFTASACPYRP